MEDNTENHNNPGDLSAAAHGNDTVSAPINGSMKDDKTFNETQNSVTTTDTTQQPKQATSVSDPRLRHPFYAKLLLSRDANEETTPACVSKRNIIYPDILKDTTKAVTIPVSGPDSGPVFDSTPTPLPGLPKYSHHLGAMLHTYQNTTSEEIKQIIGCLVNLDMMITKQTRLNELHEAHTAKNFREQRHLNKDRKLRLSATMRSVDHRFAGMDAKRMAQDTAIKQCEVRTNANALQIKSLKDETRMLAEGGKSMETEVNGMEQVITDLQGEVEGLKLANLSLRDEVRGLEDEVRGLKEKEEIWERRLAALEKLSEKGKETHLSEFCVKKEQVLNAASFAVGNGRVFSIAR